MKGILHLKDPTDPNDPTSQTVKHPQGQVAQSNCILEDVMPVPSVQRLDAHEWRRLCTSHKEASRDLCLDLLCVPIKPLSDPKNYFHRYSGIEAAVHAAEAILLVDAFL